LIVGPGHCRFNFPLAPDTRLHNPQFAGDLDFVLSFVRRILVCCACALVLCASAGPALAAPGVSAPEPSPGTQVADLAEQYVGSPYRWGGASPSGFDCTGFVMWIFSQFGVSLPHNEAGQLASGQRVSADDLEPGDVVVFANTYRAGLSHVGIYVGDGQFVHAVDEAHGVMLSGLWGGYWAPRLVGAARAIS
jgi:peptidoglycan endopeptidase LytE